MVDQVVGLVNRIHKHRIQFVLFLAKLDSIVDGIFDLTDHVLRSLVLKVFQALLDRVESVDRLIVSRKLFRLINC